jgi:hypothetical protein
MTASRSLAVIGFVVLASLSACASEVRGPADPSRAIRAVAEADLRACKPLAEGKKMAHVSVTFEESGRVAAALVDGGELLGTKAASCIERELRALQVPPFTGPSQRVARHVSLD